MTLHADFKRFEAAQQEEAVEGRERRAGDPAQARLANLGHGLLGPDDDAAQQVAMATQILRRRMHDYVGAVFERPLQGRGSKSIIDDHHGLDLVGAAHDLRDVDDAKIGIGRGLEIDDAGLFAELCR